MQEISGQPSAKPKLRFDGAGGERAEQAPRVYGINETATEAQIAITLLGWTSVRQFVRVSGIAVTQQLGRRIGRVPDLTLAPMDGSALNLVSSHLLPQGELTWLAWLFRRPETEDGDYVGRVEQITLATQSVPTREIVLNGPWTFRFRPLP